MRDRHFVFVSYSASQLLQQFTLQSHQSSPFTVHDYVTFKSSTLQVHFSNFKSSNLQGSYDLDPSNHPNDSRCYPNFNISKEMSRLRNKKKKVFVKPVVKKQLPTVDHITGDKIPKSFVFSRGKLPGSLRQLQSDLRKLMLPYTALKLKEKKRNNLEDFLNVAGPMGVTHFLILSKTETAPYLRVARTPQGPTLTFKIHKYSLATDVAQSQLRPRCPQDLFKNSPLIVLSGFGTGEQHLKLTTIMFQNIFPGIDINSVKLSSCQRIVLLDYNKETKLIDFRHYSIRLQPIGVSRRIRKFVQNHQVPDLRSLQDVSDFVYEFSQPVNRSADSLNRSVGPHATLGILQTSSNWSAGSLTVLSPNLFQDT
ncbi:hypothetical protein F0562_015320 [Nyssa sinensis]|uniref:Brix domain-containing protein n=1 Tax=Nyssa sinensis TaxID=561372 RepID=A0A5J4ZJV5_9ASTE|nr:hypothetical protein F0562_015320 [Nyssa sinensis]